MRKRLFVACVALLLALGLLYAIRGFGGGPAQPLAVLIQGRTSCVVSNQSNRTIKVWAVAYAQTAPFSQTNNPNQWKIIGNFKDAYLKPGETIRFTFHAPPTSGKWRLMIPWSEGYRSRIRDQVHEYKWIPVRFRIAPEFYAPSTVMDE